MPELEWVIYYLVLGLFIGYFSGLLGIGGGLIMVPVLTFMFEAQHFPANNILHLALGTSMATIIFTSISSTKQHHAYGAVSWKTVRYMTPGILLGTLLGAWIISFVANIYLTLFFVVFVYLSASQMLLGFKPNSTRISPERKGAMIAGMVIGAVSSIVSIGGGVLSVPYLLWHQLSLRHAIATSAAIGFPIAIGGTIGYVINGYLGGVDLPVNSLGYLYLPALIWLVIGTMLTAPLGAQTTHLMPLKRLRQIFALVLFILATKMLINAFL
jgi:uncharacterized membrane protein YfcA